MMEQRTDGMISCYSYFNAEQSRQLLAYGFPVVLVNHQAADRFHYSIYHDDTDGCQQVTHHLISLGHKKIAHLGNSRSGRTTQDRLTGFQNALQHAGLPVHPEWIHHVSGGDPDLGTAAAGYYQNLVEPPTAVVCFNDTLVIGLLKGFQQAGVRVPEDISITGFDNINYSAYACPSLTTFDQPKHSIGAKAAQLLLELLRKDASHPLEKSNIKVVQGKLLVRDSPAAPRTDKTG